MRLPNDGRKRRGHGRVTVLRAVALGSGLAAIPALALGVASEGALGGAVPGAASTGAAASYFSARVTASATGQIRLSVKAPAGTRVEATEIDASSAAGGASNGPIDASETAIASSPAGPPPVAVPGSGRLLVSSEARGAVRLGSWSCERRDRRYRVVVTFPDGTVRIVERGARSPSCDRRLTIELGEFVLRRAVRVTVRDRFGLGGFTAHVCLDAAGGGRPRATRCSEAVFPEGRRSVRLTLGRAAAGRSNVTARAPFGRTIRRAVLVRRAGRRFTLLATGDSMIQIVDGFLKQRLGRLGGRVTSDAHISTGLSKPFMFNWPRHAASSAASVHPDVTVMIVGANDGFPLGGASCCGDAWTRAYADRAADMMRSYLRGGRGRVIWMLLPAPRRGNFVPVMRAVNDALRRAAARYRPDQVTLLDLPATFTPGGVFRDGITWQGAYRHVRQPDGVHLNTAGASIAAELVMRQLRRDGFLG